MAKDKLKNRKNIIVIVSMIITATIIVLSALPFSVVLNFTAVTESGEVILIPGYYSAFAIITVGYGRFGSWLTAILSCVMFILFSVNLFVKNEIVHNIVFGIAVFAFVDSIFPFIFSEPTVITPIISILCLLLIIINIRKSWLSLWHK